MKKNTLVSSKNTGFDSQFKSLNNEEMINLRGGANSNPLPPTPPTGGDDYPLSLSAGINRLGARQSIPVLVISVPAEALANAAVSLF